MPTLNEIIFEAARRSGAAFSSSATAGTTSLLEDTAAEDYASNATFANGGTIFLPDGAAADQQRRVSAWDVTNKGYTPTRNWGTAPSASDTYELYGLLPPFDTPGAPESWQRLVNRALKGIWVKDEIEIGRGDGTKNNRFSVASTQPFVVIFAGVIEDGASPTISSGPTGFVQEALELGGTAVRMGLWSKPGQKDDPENYEFTLAQTTSPAFAVALSYGRSRGFKSTTTTTDPIGALTESLGATSQNHIAVGGWAKETPGNDPVYYAADADMTQRFLLSYDDLGAALTLGGDVVIGDVEMSESQSLTFAPSFPTSSTDDGVGMQGLVQPMLNVDQPKRLGYQYHIDTTYVVQAAGNGTTLRVPRPDFGGLNDIILNEHTIRRVLFRRLVGDYPYDTDMGKGGRFWRYLPSGEILTSRAPTEEETVVVEVNRPYAPLDAAKDTTDCPLDLAALGARYKLYQYLNSVPATRGDYNGEEEAALREFMAEYRQHSANPVISGV